MSYPGVVLFLWEGLRLSGDCQMATRLWMTAALAALLALATESSARILPPLVPTALVEDITSTTAAVEFMDYVGTGQVIELEPHDVLVLSYLKSCAHETITGGTVQIGAEHSEVKGGKIATTKVACDGGKIRLTSQQANASGASAFRLQSAEIEPVLYALPPVVQLPRNLTAENRTLVIERIDRRGERTEIKLGGELARRLLLRSGQGQRQGAVPRRHLHAPVSAPTR